MEVFGRNVTVVMVHNPELERGQLQGILINREKATSRLFELQQQLVRRANGEVKKGRKPTVESVTNHIESILEAEYMKDIFSYEVFERNNNIYLTFASSDEALETIRTSYLGRTALFTDRNDFTTEEIVSAIGYVVFCLKK